MTAGCAQRHCLRRVKPTAQRWVLEGFNSSRMIVMGCLHMRHCTRAAAVGGGEGTWPRCKVLDDTIQETWLLVSHAGSMRLHAQLFFINIQC